MGPPQSTWNENTMAILTRRKTAAAALVIVGIAGLSIASAAQLNITEKQTLAAGEVEVGSCQGEAKIKVSFDNTYDALTKKYVTSGVKLSNINTLCEGLSYKVTVVGGNAPELTGEIVAPVTTATFAAPVSVKAVTDVAVIIFD